MLFRSLHIRMDMAKVIKDRGDHSNMTSEKIGKYKELLCQLEPLFEEYDYLPKDMS